MSSPLEQLDLSALPPEYRAAFEALAEITKRQEALIKELRHALYGKRSEKLTEDERQLAFEDLEIAVSEVEAAKDTLTPSTAPGEKRSPPNRNIGNLPKELPRVEEIIEPESLECPCGCGEMHKIGEDRTERLDIIPAQLQVLRHHPAQIRLPVLHGRSDPGTHTRLADRGRASH